MKSKPSHEDEEEKRRKMHASKWWTIVNLAKLTSIVNLMLLVMLVTAVCRVKAYEYRTPRSYEVQQQQHYPQQAQQYSYGPSPPPPSYFTLPPPPINYQKYYKQFLPGPQYCPETGRTVCSRVAPYYPTEEVFSVIKMARAKHFNISSEFIDESDNDEEPHLEDDFETSFHEWPAPVPFKMSPGPPLSEQTQQQVSSASNDFDPHSSSSSSSSSNYHKPVAQYHNYDYNLSGHSNPRPPMSPTYGYRPYEKANHRYHEPQQHEYYGTKSAVHGHSYPAAPAAQRHRYKRQATGGNNNANPPNEALPNEPICPSRTIIIEPRAAMNDKSQWKFVVNLSDRDPRLKQSIKVEVCRTPNRPCSSQIALPFGFTSRCRQKYIKKKLISLDPSGQSISSENFFAPSCCVCEVIRIPPQTSPVAPPPPPPSPSSSSTSTVRRTSEDGETMTSASANTIHKKENDQSGNEESVSNRNH